MSTGSCIIHMELEACRQVNACQDARRWKLLRFQHASMLGSIALKHIQRVMCGQVPICSMALQIHARQEVARHRLSPSPLGCWFPGIQGPVAFLLNLCVPHALLCSCALRVSPPKLTPHSSRQAPNTVFHNNVISSITLPRTICRKLILYQRIY